MIGPGRIGPEARPLLPRGVRLHWDRVRGTWTLLAPERAIRLDAIGHAILAEVDGARDVAAIATALAARFDAPAEEVLGDVREFLGGLAERRLVDCA
jgi:pyrroloquinoline quinone biosynthesis protein D